MGMHGGAVRRTGGARSWLPQPQPLPLLRARHVQSAAGAAAAGGGVSRERHPKRVVALVVAYEGSAWRGLACQGAGSGVDTIGDTLQAALHSAGYISDANAPFPSKCGWAYMSRTDAGVHALRNIVSVRVRAGAGAFDDGTPDHSAGGEIVEALNARVPGALRVLSAQRCRGSFNIRGLPTARSYAYYVPRAMLSGADAAARLREALEHFVGRHPVHNFTTARLRAACVPAPGGAFASDFASAAACALGASAEWAVLPSVWRRVDSWAVRDARMGGVDFLEATVTGTSFMQEQVCAPTAALGVPGTRPQWLDARRARADTADGGARSGGCAGCSAAGTSPRRACAAEDAGSAARACVAAGPYRRHFRRAVRSPVRDGRVRGRAACPRCTCCAPRAPTAVARVMTVMAV